MTATILEHVILYLEGGAYLNRMRIMRIVDLLMFIGMFLKIRVKIAHTKFPLGKPGLNSY